MKKCNKCLVTKDTSDFAKRNKNGKTGLQSKCKQCNREYRQSRKDLEKEYRREYRKRKPVNGRAKMLKYSYGLTLEDYNDLLIKQNGVCAICKKEVDLLVVDHNHSCCPGPRSCSKCIRGLLCKGCNLGIGYFKDNNEYLKNAVEYLQSFSEE